MKRQILLTFRIFFTNIIFALKSLLDLFYFLGFLAASQSINQSKQIYTALLFVPFYCVCYFDYFDCDVLMFM